MAAYYWHASLPASFLVQLPLVVAAAAADSLSTAEEQVLSSFQQLSMLYCWSALHSMQ
jgi:hypothetical protein